MFEFKFATNKDIDEVFNLYKYVIQEVDKSPIKLGWKIDIYPNMDFVVESIKNKELCILLDKDKIIAAAVVNHNVNKEYDDISWDVMGPKDKVSTIHALATLPEYRGKVASDEMLKNIDKYCKDNNDLAIHLDVIDSNFPAYKLYARNGYKEKACIKMYYEVVGLREFFMLEKIL